jgi:hypothetical protein
MADDTYKGFTFTSVETQSTRTTVKITAKNTHGDTQTGTAVLEGSDDEETRTLHLRLLRKRMERDLDGLIAKREEREKQKSANADAKATNSTLPAA